MLYEFLAPRLEALVREAEAAGFEREAVVAVILDLISSPPYDTVGPEGDGAGE